MDVLINKMGGILSQCTRISNYVHFKYFVCQLCLKKVEKKNKKNYLGIKLSTWELNSLASPPGDLIH